MSIAVSAIIRPSRMLAAIVFTMSGVLLGAAALLWLEADSIFHESLAGACALAGSALGLFPLLRRKSVRIDVTGIGQIRLADTSSDAQIASTNPSMRGVEVVQMLRDSTFWSSLMVLRLQSGSGRVTVLTILPDSMERSAFHALSVACRWIAARQISPQTRPFDAIPPG